MKKLFILIAWVSAFFMSCSKDDSNDILWKPDTLVETVWEGRIIRDNIENKIVVSFVSKEDGFCYMNSDKTISCLFEYDMTNNQIIFSNIYDGDKNLIIEGMWHFDVSEKKRMRLIQFEAADKQNVIEMKRICNRINGCYYED